ncbi:hypothetical protein B484DRAFT_400007 [Ochromonadaceae sp. CCMP2298]|nr:hypothetical protein B484DRAFT_400007 [Ochromonadaceae sp. CCMP2298]
MSRAVLLCCLVLWAHTSSLRPPIHPFVRTGTGLRQGVQLDTGAWTSGTPLGGRTTESVRVEIWEGLQSLSPNSSAESSVTAESSVSSMNSGSSGSSGSSDSKAQNKASNKALQDTLRGLGVEGVDALLCSLDSSPSDMYADTVNIFIRDAVERGSLARAELLFDRYFTSGAVAPTARSVNVVMEAYRQQRKDYVQVQRYYSLFTRFDLQPDSFTLSTLVRAASSPAEVQGLLQTARELGILFESPPLLRCALETLGQLGAPSQALYLASEAAMMQMQMQKQQRQIQKQQQIQAQGLEQGLEQGIEQGQEQEQEQGRELSIFLTERTGDALIAALLYSPSTLIEPIPIEPIPIATQGPPDRATDIDIDTDIRDIFAATAGRTAVDAALALLLPSGGEAGVAMRCSSRGYCSLLTYVQRSMRTIVEAGAGTGAGETGSGSSGSSTKQLRALRGTRDQLWRRVKADVVRQGW